MNTEIFNMKNIHILPTDKPSRYVTNYMEKEMQWNNIYITSDEEIKKGDWFYNPATKEALYASKEMLSWNCDTTQEHKGWKKIILTTDQDLIKDGVQAIDDEFLEWFVKNPSCEEVKVRKNPKVHFIVKGKGVKGFNQGYKIIIPKKENSIEAKQRAANYMSLKGALEPKQETTLEEYISEVTKNFGDEMSIKFTSGGIKLGAKWQLKKMYSEAIEFAEWIRIKDFQTTSKDNWIGLDMKYYTTEELFEQFKKK